MAVAHEAVSAVRLEPSASKAAERLFQQHSGWIYGYCLRHLRSPEEAEDALQATYLNACRSLKRGFVPRTDSAWLLTVAHNVCISRLRSSGRRARLEWPQDAEVLEDMVAAPARAADELIGLPEALATLPEQQRRAILLREWQGLSYREVADELGLTQSAVETLIFRARRSLAAALEHPDARRPRALHGFNLAGLGAALKSLFAGGAGGVGVKAATLAAVAATATVVATDPVGWHRPAAADSAPKPVAAVVPAAPVAPSPSAAAAVEHQELAATAAAEAPTRNGLAVAESKRRGNADASPRRHPKGKGRERAEAAKANAGQGKGQAKAKDAPGQGKGQAKSAASQAGSSRSEGAPGRPTFAGSGGPPPRAENGLPAHAASGAKGPEKAKKP